MHMYGCDAEIVEGHRSCSLMSRISHPTFCTNKKWDLNNVKLKAVTAQVSSSTHRAPRSSSTNSKKSIRLGDAESVLEAAGKDTSYSHLKTAYAGFKKCDDVAFILDILRQETLALCGGDVTPSRSDL